MGASSSFIVDLRRQAFQRISSNITDVGITIHPLCKYNITIVQTTFLESEICVLCISFIFCGRYVSLIRGSIAQCRTGVPNNQPS